MTLKWLKVILAGLVEIIWVTGLNNADSILSWLFTLIFIILSFYLVIDATKSLPVGTVYAIFVGIGAAGTVIVDMLFFDQPFTFMKILLVTLLILGIIGLKLSTTDDVEGGSK
ncbi:small multidrug resistance protein 1 [Staphylococcus pasteuri SP1]|nr:small multidrug resistance protein 1 [Staphylococcus pasteuri SP1]